MLKVQEIREIIRLIDESSIDEFTYETDGSKLKLKKSSNAEKNVVANQTNLIEQPTVTSDQKVVQEIQEVHKEIVNEPEQQLIQEQTIDYDHEIVSPMVGTFYQAPSPESDPYVKKNSEVENDTVVCIVEAMKLFNEIEADVSGTIVEVLVEDGELVEYGQPLFRVKKK